MTNPEDQKNADKEIDAHGSYVMPGIIDLHVHGGEPIPDISPEYYYKLWLAHGITTVRGVPLGDLDGSLAEKKRSALNEIVAPRIVSYHVPGQAKDGGYNKILTAKDARKWVKYSAKLGVDGIKFFNAESPEIMKVILDEAKKFKLGSTAHLGQTGVVQTNARDAARMGLGSLTHANGVLQALLKDFSVHPYPPGVNISNEQDAVRYSPYQWNMIHERGSKEWNVLLDEFLANDFYLNPTLAITSANRDLMRARNADWHSDYTLPTLWEYFQANRQDHGSWHYYWTTADEVAWKNFYRVWMSFLNDYKNKGGKVTVGSDARFVYQTYGFATILEMELLQEAGFNPLEVIRAATMHSAMEIFKPKEKPIEYGVVRPGMLADIIIIDENPLENLKVLYGTGALKLNDVTGRLDRVGGVKYTIKDGIVYDAKQLLRDVAAMVAEQKTKKAINSQAVPVEVILETKLGAIEIELYTDKAPLSSASFLDYLDKGLLSKHGSFYRAVRADNDQGAPTMNLIQGGVLGNEQLLSQTIAHESTEQTGLSHSNGAISLARARDNPDSGNGGTFFISIGDQSLLDHGGVRANQGDGEGYAVFGKVTKGMDVVRAIQTSKTTHWPNQSESPKQYMDPIVRITHAFRR